MAIFDFGDVGSFNVFASAGVRIATFSTTVTGAGLNDDTMKFTFVISSPGGGVASVSSTGGAPIVVGFSAATDAFSGVSMRFSDGAGNNVLSNVIGDISAVGAAPIWVLEGGALAPVQIATPAPGNVIGMQFITFSAFPTGVLINSLTGTPLCFAAGTDIATPKGQRAVETLEAGDLVETMDGRAVPVVWVGRQSFDTTVGVPDRLRLVRIAAGALREALPVRDLVVTADHALFLDGCLVNAGALVGQPGIELVAVEDLPQEVTVYHIETERHEVLLAEGAPTESFIDYANRGMFENTADAGARRIEELPYPRITRAEQLTDRLRAG